MMGVRSQVRLLLIVAALGIVISPACSKKEEAKAPSSQKVKKFTPESAIVPQEKLELWLNASERVGEFIRKFSLADEEVRNKDEFMFLAHSSERTEAILKELFKGIGLQQGEFWWILDRLNDAKKYEDLTISETSQNKRIDVILAAGREERVDTEKALAKELSESGRKELSRRLGIINAKFSELSSLKGRTTPEMIGVDPANMELWRKNRDRVEPAIKKMWKVVEGKKEEPRDKSIPGH